MPKTIIFVMCAVLFMAACSFDSSGLNSSVNNSTNNANNTNNSNNTNNTNNVDPCDDVDCGEGSCIVIDATNYSCECHNNWTGDACDECKEAYTGDDCNECAGEALLLEDGSCGVNHCDAADICNHHGDCSVDLSTGDYSCACAIGYDDNTDCASCEEFFIEYPVGSGACVVDSCIGVDCQNGGDCLINGASSFICQCETAYAGEFCEGCDTANGYILQGLACQLSPCHNFDCGHGECVVDATSFTASCDCDPGFVGESYFEPQYCGYDLSDVLVYQSYVDELAVQVQGIWGYFSSDFRVIYEGSSTGVTVVYLSGQADSDVDLLGWVYLDPCQTGVSETAQLTVQKSPYNGSDVLTVENEADPDIKDPHQIIAAVNISGTWIDRFQVQCTCSGGNCTMTPLGN